MLNFILTPTVSIIRRLQFVLALAIFFYAGLAKLENDPLSQSPAFLHVLGNVLLMGSLWVAFFECIAFRYLVLAAFAISFSCELAQSLTLTRTTDPWDFLLNTVGILIGGVGCYLMQRVLNKKPIQ